jgi:phospholipase C
VTRAAVLVATAVVALAAAAAAAAAAPVPRTPISHFVTLMQEHHSFDNYFGTYPGADGLPPRVCMPLDVARPRGRCVRPFHLGGHAVKSLSSDQRTFLAQLGRGRMNGFLDVYRRQGIDGTIAMGHYDARDLPFYWNVAGEYVLFDRFFAAAPVGTLQNHMYWMTGTPGSRAPDVIPRRGFGRLPTIFDRLDARGISWKVYVQNYDPSVSLRTVARRARPGGRGSRLLRLPLLAFPRYVDDPRLSRHVVGLPEFYDDAAHGTLPAVSYIIPAGAGEHPPGSIRSGQSFVRSLVNSLVRSPVWTSSAFLWTYDGWGGWYDHVRPPRGYGFRVPALLVSPYARRGHVDSTTLDSTSILRFIELNWGLDPLARRDAAARTFMSAFDFGHGPRPARFLAADRATATGPEPRRSVIYVLYSSAVVLALSVLAWPLAIRRRRTVLAAGEAERS